MCGRKLILPNDLVNIQLGVADRCYLWALNLQQLFKLLKIFEIQRFIVFQSGQWHVFNFDEVTAFLHHLPNAQVTEAIVSVWNLFALLVPHFQNLNFRL